MKSLKYLIPLIWLLQLGCVPAHKSDNVGNHDSEDAVTFSDINQEESISEYTGLNDGYDFKNVNTIDSVHIICDLSKLFYISIYNSGYGYAYDIVGSKEQVSEFFCRATLEDIDALFVQETVPIELSREENKYHTLDNPMTLTFRIYYNGIQKVDKLIFDSRYNVEYSVRFDNLFHRLNNIGRIVYEGYYSNN